MMKIPDRELDVRPYFVAGHDPLERILAEITVLAKDQSLVLHAPFEPIPLYEILSAHGFQHQASMQQDGSWRIRFEPIGPNGAIPGRDLDLRELPPPEPMVRALEAAATLSREEELVIHTRHCPTPLLDQLETRGFDSESIECGENHWETRIWRVGEVERS